MSEIVDRVAAAIEKLLTKGDERVLLFDDAYQELARAAIAAMREASPAMVKAGQKNRAGDTFLTVESVLARWDGMIDAALKDT